MREHRRDKSFVVDHATREWPLGWIAIPLTVRSCGSPALSMVSGLQSAEHALLLLRAPASTLRGACTGGASNHDAKCGANKEDLS